MSSTGYIHSTESFGSVDGPGIRFLIFLQGCRMRCRYCHNPDTWKLGSDACGTTATVDELLNKAERYRSYWGPDGGITVSGGEALLQIDFLIELFEEAHRRGINTCLDTAAQPFTREEPFFGKFAICRTLLNPYGYVMYWCLASLPTKSSWCACVSLLTHYKMLSVLRCCRITLWAHLNGRNLVFLILSPKFLPLLLNK